MVIERWRLEVLKNVVPGGKNGLQGATGQDGIGKAVATPLLQAAKPEWLIFWPIAVTKTGHVDWNLKVG